MPKEFLSTLASQERLSSEERRIWKIFDEISKIPRTSGEEEKIRAYILEFAKNREVESAMDAEENILLFLPATPGFEEAPGVVIQTHLDMVCLGTPDPAKHGVTPRVDETGTWVMGTKTTLGADNGIGVASALALIDDRTPHGKLALLFTNDEEESMKGALHIGFADILPSYTYLLNLDSEDEGVATFSSAGGVNSELRLHIDRESNGTASQMKIVVQGLLGGHSGVEIQKGRISSIQVIRKVLEKSIQSLPSVKLVHLEAGLRMNAIPSDGEFILEVADHEKEQLNEILETIRSELLKESAIPEESTLTIVTSELAEQFSDSLSRESSERIARLLNTLPHGVLEWSADIAGLVQTSTNLAIIGMTHEELTIKLMSRGSVNETLTVVTESIRSIGTDHGAKVVESNHYPGWKANPKNPLVPIAKEAWRTVSPKELIVEAIHAGLECGIILDRFPTLEALSIGPTILDAHTITEKVDIRSVGRFYTFVHEILKRVASERDEK